MRHRGEKHKNKRPGSSGEGAANGTAERLDHVKKEVTAAVASEWDYKIALVVVTILAFATRFYKISHPDQVVFDEVHFGKVWRI
jgi:dolichyl-phosphate-mannose-protein mannosyltransferase